MSGSEGVPKGRKDLWTRFPKELVQIISEYLLPDSFGVHACPSPEADGTNIRYSVWLQIVFGPHFRPDILRNRMQLVVSDMNFLKDLPGKDWLSEIHLRFFYPPSMASGLEEISNFKSLRRISADCFQDSGESVHKRLTTASPNVEIMITSILVSEPGTSNYARHRRHQLEAKIRTRSQSTCGKAPHIMTLALPRGYHPHSPCSDNQESHLGTGVHGDIMYEKAEPLWFCDKLSRWLELEPRT
ncbi:uncharacterized protein BKA55DRAFT_680652 [Fusarium redolens]|uniref:Uncharacterized protein n=1 Tax=Fusarium redolens TaxID=48865 RepID=A0A9P9JQU0_FUSRE|nr:uncharacterized protein BKA55DRAFT_680652 [Fusarium redolens]KAH7228443.1 hypothetical protein BKA55DRAFT_680652 [Fusarium redolens]